MVKPSFKWEDNLVCRSVYLILADASLMDEMVSQRFPFEAAEAVKMSQLNFFILSRNTSASQRDSARRSRAVKFTRLLITLCEPKWKAPKCSADIVQTRLIMMFAQADITLRDVAAYIDQQFIISQLPIEI